MDHYCIIASLGEDYLEELNLPDLYTILPAPEEDKRKMYHPTPQGGLVPEECRESGVGCNSLLSVSDAVIAPMEGGIQLYLVLMLLLLRGKHRPLFSSGF